MNTWRSQLRFVLPLIVLLVCVAELALPLIDRATVRWFTRDLTLRGEVIATSMADSIEAALRLGDTARLQMMIDRLSLDERLFAAGLCGLDDRMVVRTDGLPATVSCAQAHKMIGSAAPPLRLDGGAMAISVHAVPGPDGPLATLVLLHDLGFVENRSKATQRYLVALLVGLGLLTAAITLTVARWSWRGWVDGTRALLRGEELDQATLPVPSSELAPIADELRERLRDLEDEFRRGLGPEREWTPDRLRTLLHTRLRGDQVIVVSNREPYIHERLGDQVFVRRPASGLVTAIEPVMRACSGTWISHGSGSADREVVDEANRIRVPPEHPTYDLRRVWLSEDEEHGYYNGFSNEGLWPLCHVAHVRPVFRQEDWLTYQAVNERFADAVAEEARVEDPLVLVQDYHFALLPALVRERLPRATILTFWHIPWPNPESFGICPWRRELLRGMLGSSILGFHTRYHCKNFLEAVDRYLEARIEHEHSVIVHQEDETYVEAYPISIAWPTEADKAHWIPVDACREGVIARFGLAADVKIAVGVDRFDYTKGILERLNAVERFLEKHPEWVGRFVLVQVAAPSRSSLEEYRAFVVRVHEQVERINTRFASGGRVPVILLAEHHEPEAVTTLYRAADVCLVTSLHDGMNLVAKEFVAARDDERGVLILSRFAGAAHEMSEALIVNPYHVEETADAIATAVAMSPAEQRERIASLRTVVREYNVYRWAGRMLTDAGQARLRQRIAARVERHRRA